MKFDRDLEPNSLKRVYAYELVALHMTLRTVVAPLMMKLFRNDFMNPELFRTVM
jgi:hypothetical protein